MSELKAVKAVFFLLSLLALGSTLLPAHSAAAERKGHLLSVRIVPMSAPENDVRAITLFTPAQHFYVVVTNVSQEPIRLWREWCSWGYYNLSFKVTDDTGKTTVVKKKPREWRKNYPDSTILGPGDHMVFEVSFDEATWEGAPLPEQHKSRRVKMSAVFEIPEDQDTRKMKVWTGKASSPELTYTIYR